MLNLYKKEKVHGILNFKNGLGKITLDNNSEYSIIHINENTYSPISNQGVNTWTIEIKENKIVDGRATMYRTPMLETPVSTRLFFTFISELKTT